MSYKLSTMINSINVMGFDIKVEFVEELSVDGEDCYGCYLPNKDLIKILHGDTVTHEKQLATLIHETVEAVNDKLEMTMEHRDVTTMESFIFTLMRNNPQLAKSFTLYRR